MSIVERIQAFVAEHADQKSVVALRHGEPMSDAQVKSLLKENGAAMPASLRAVLERWGYLEIDIAPDVWPHSTYQDGLRFFGAGPNVPERLSLARQVAAYRAEFERIERFAKTYNEKPSLPNSNFKQAKARTPAFSTLEGLTDSWCSNTKSVAWFYDFAHYSIRGGVLPRDSPLFEVSDPEAVVEILLRRLGYRMKRASELSALIATLRSLGGVHVRGDQHLRSEAMPEIEWYVWPASGEPSVRAVRRVGFLPELPKPDDLGQGTFALRGDPEGFDRKCPVVVSLGLLPGTRIDLALVKDVELALARGDALARGEKSGASPSRDLARITLDRSLLDNAYSEESWVAK